MNEQTRQILLQKQFSMKRQDTSVTFRISEEEKAQVLETVRSAGFKNIGTYFLSLHRAVQGNVK